MTAIRWARPLAPQPGELLSSCLCRNAFSHGLSPHRFLNLLRNRDPVWNRDFDRDPETLLRIDRGPKAPSWPEDLAECLGIPVEAVRDATLAKWRSALGTNVAAGAADSRLILSAGVYHRTRHRHALQYCPDCLAGAKPWFRQEWRLGFVIRCREHNRPLRDACPYCDATVIPHRSRSNRLVDCHRCGRDIRKDRPGIPDAIVPLPAADLQNRMLAFLARANRGTDELSCSDRGWSDLPLTLRSLLAVSAPPRVHRQLREALDLAPHDDFSKFGRRRFEHARLAVRIPWLETVSVWTSRWPRNFHVGAEAIGASGRTFARCAMSPTVAREVCRLPERHRAPAKPWAPVLDEPVLRRLRRTDRTAYHALRAERIFDKIGA